MAETIKGINVVIGAETTGLSKALGDVNKKSKDIQSELKQVDKLLKLDPSNIELLAQKQKLLSEAVATTKEKLDRLKSAQEQVNQQFQQGEISEGQYRAFQREVASTEQELDKLEDQLKKINPSVQAFGEKAKEAGEKLSDAGGKLTTGVTVPLVAAGAGLVAVGMQFDDAFDRIRTGTGATGKALEGLKEDFRSVAAEVPSSFEEISTAIADYNTRLGLTGKPLQDLSAQTLNLARITGGDLAKTIEDTSQSFRAFNIPTNEYGKSLDYVFKVSQSTGISVDRLQQNLVKFAPALKQLGLGFNESATLMGQLDKAGVDVEQALAGLNKAVVALAKDGVTNANEAIKILFGEIKKAPTDLQGTEKALEIFGAKAGPALASAIREGKLSYEDLLNTLQKSNETINGVAEDTDDWAEGFAKLKNQLMLALEPLAGDFFDAISKLTPILTGLIQGITKIVEVFTSWPSAVQTAILVILGLLAALGPVLSMLGALFTAAGALAVPIAALAAPIAIAILAIGALIAVGVLLYKNWDDIKKKLSDIWKGISDTANNVWNTIKAFFKKWGDEIFLIAVGPAGWAVLLARKIAENWDAIKNTVTTVWDGIKTFLSSVWDSIKGIAVIIWESIRQVVTQPVQGIKSNMENTWNGIKSTTQSVWNNIKSLITSPIESAKQTILGIISSVKNAFANMKITIPKPKLPHITVSVKYKSLGGIDIPYPDFDLKWYAKGTNFHPGGWAVVGEEGPELLDLPRGSRVVPNDKLGAVAGGDIIVQQMIVRSDQDIYLIARELETLRQREARGRGLK